MFGKARFVLQFTRRLAFLLGAEIPLHTALELIAHQQKGKRWKQMVESITTDVASHSGLLSKALRPYLRTFGDGYILTVQWAESRGGLQDMLIALHLLGDDFCQRSTNRLSASKVETNLPFWGFTRELAQDQDDVYVGR